MDSYKALFFFFFVVVVAAAVTDTDQRVTHREPRSNGKACRPIHKLVVDIYITVACRDSL